MVIGIMGGIGSGKSTVLNYLKEAYNAEIIQSDLVAKEVMQPGKSAFLEIEKHFPDVMDNGIINNNLLSKLVFKDKNKLNQLNNITHPATINEIISRIDSFQDGILVIESALLIGSGIEKICDELWFVYCEKETRINRLIYNRGYSREKSINIIDNQPSDEDYNFYADEFIDNSNDENFTKEQIDIALGKRYC